MGTFGIVRHPRLAGSACVKIGHERAGQRRQDEEEILVTEIAMPAVDAYSEACRRKPSLARDSHSRRSVELYGWRTGPTKEVHIAQTRELILSVHLGGARRVRVFTEQGLSRSFSKPGDITLIPRGQAVSYRTEGEVEFATVHFPIDALMRCDGGMEEMSNLQVCLFALHDDYVLSSVKTLMHAPNSPSRDSARYFATLFDALTCHIARIVEQSDAEQIRLTGMAQPAITGPNFDEVLKQIETRLAEKLSLQELAEHAGVCRSIFAQQFAERFGCSAHRFITQRRIEKAKSLLVQGKLSVTDIAFEVGFSGQSHFSTTFKTITGSAPTAYAGSAQ